jgi:thiol:disulfide interchange protein DsbD
MAAPAIPPGKVKFDETFQKNVETYRGMLRIILPIQQASHPFRVAVTYQGCAEKGLCYPPAQMRADVNLAAFGGDGSVRVLPGREIPIAASASDTIDVSVSTTAPSPAGAVNTASAADGTGTEAALRSGGFWKVIGAFFLAGVVLSLTPCVLPMVPILSSIIVGQGDGTSTKRGRSFALAASYSLGMALIYTALGVAAGLAGEGLAATLQNPWVLSAFALMLVGLSLSMFGVYELQLPSSFTSPLSEASHRLPAGRFAGVFLMGGLSALIVSPCVAAPLAAALVFISQTRDVWLGGTGLFALSAGMSVPLLLVGASAGALLPRAGAWMNDVKHVFGVLLIAVALWIVQPVLPASVALGLWGALLVGSAVALIEGGRGQAPSLGGWARKAAAAMLAIFGTIQIVGATSGGTDPLHPLSHLTASRSAPEIAGLAFAPVHSVSELDAALDSARKANRPVMLDFYADWCVSCKEMEHLTFTDATVRVKLANATLLKADVTKNNADDRELLKRFQLFGPPGTIFYDAQGRELVPIRVIGFQNTERFLETLRAVGL